MLRYTILFLLFSVSVFAQTRTPKRTDTTDLRTHKSVFEIIFTENKQKNFIQFKSNAQGNYHLHHLVGTKLISSKKLTSENAQKIDEEFVDKFITMKYMMGESDIKKCDTSIELKMRGEDFEVCQKDKKRNDLVKEFIKKMKQIL